MVSRNSQSTYEKAEGVRGYANHYKSTIRSLYMINIVPEVKIVMIDST